MCHVLRKNFPYYAKYKNESILNIYIKTFLPNLHDYSRDVKISVHFVRL